MGSPVQERGDSGGSSNRQLGDQNGVKRAVQGFWMGGPGWWLGEWAQSGLQTQSHVSVYQM